MSRIFYGTSNDKYSTITICWKYTEVCNLNCSYCNLPNNSKITNEDLFINKLIYTKLKKEAKKYKDINFLVDIEGGEPTLNEEVFNLKSTDNLKFKLFTNFKNPNIKKLIDFSKHSKIEFSLNLFFYSKNKEYYLNNYFKLFNSKELNKDNISVSILLQDIENLDIELKQLDNFFKTFGIEFFYSIPENFNEINTFSYLDKYINARRIKYSFYNYYCNCNFLQASCKSKFFTNCSLNWKELIIQFDAKKYLNQKFLCKNNICGIHDNQIIYNKIKGY